MPSSLRQLEATDSFPSRKRCRAVVSLHGCKHYRPRSLAMRGRARLISSTTRGANNPLLLSHSPNPRCLATRGWAKPLLSKHQVQYLTAAKSGSFPTRRCLARNRNPLRAAPTPRRRAAGDA